MDIMYVHVRKQHMKGEKWLQTTGTTGIHWCECTLSSLMIYEQETKNGQSNYCTHSRSVPQDLTNHDTRINNHPNMFLPSYCCVYVHALTGALAQTCLNTSCELYKLTLFMLTSRSCMSNPVAPWTKWYEPGLLARMYMFQSNSTW